MKKHVIVMLVIMPVLIYGQTGGLVRITGFPDNVLQYQRVEGGSDSVFCVIIPGQHGNYLFIDGTWQRWDQWPVQSVDTGDPIIRLIKLWDEYAAKCRADSVEEITTLIHDQGIVSVIGSHWVHEEPTFQGFMEFIRLKMRREE
jgi:hypothetical protein